MYETVFKLVICMCACASVCVCVPAERDKVTGGSAPRSVWPHLPVSLVQLCGHFNQTVTELTADPAGLCMSPAAALS